MLDEKIEKIPNMVKNKKETTPRRRASLGKSGAIGKVTKALSRPVSSTASCVPTACNIKVVVRVRPPNDREKNENFHNVVKVVDDQLLIFDPKDEEQPFFYHGVQQKGRDLLKKAKKDISFFFDRVFSNAATNVEVFINSTHSLINTLMDGCNCSVFAYGATGAGKTFTMIGNTENPGITYLTMRDLFKRKEELSNEREFELMVTYIEVYNELVKDLLNPGVPLNLREDAKYGVLIPGVKGHKISSADDLFSLLEQGNRRRTQHPTDANAESSRSHAVFQVYVQMTMKSTREVRRAKLSMIDLAGSERGSATGFVGARFKEGANINKSLLALGNCINSLADGNRHVPYRDSKLTRLLKDSLGGNCHTIMIANVSPSSMSFDDTYNTLKYATRAKKIKSNIKRNIVNVDLHVDQYIKLVDDLQKENTTLKSENVKMKKEIDQLRNELLQCCTPEQNCDIEVYVKENRELIKERDKLKQQNEELLQRVADEGKCESANAELIQRLNSLKQRANSYHEEMEALKLQHEELMNTSIDASTPKKIPNADGLDITVLENFRSLVNTKKELIEREFQLQSCELGMSLRRELKVETKDRLSKVYVYSPDKEDMRKRLNEQVERYEKKEKCTKTKLEEIQNEKMETELVLEEFVHKHPDLQEQHKLASLDLELLEHRHTSKLKQKEIEILLDDHKDKCVTIDRMATMLRKLFLAMGGKHDAPESIKADYEDLVNAFNGKKRLKWQETGFPLTSDSGISSLDSLQDANDEEKGRAVKRKIETDSQVSLDSTFTCENMRTPRPHGAKTPTGVKINTVNTQMVAKGFKAPAAKRLAHGVSPRGRLSPRTKVQFPNKISPSRSKENALYLKKTTVRPNTVRTLLNVKKSINEKLAMTSKD